MNCPVCPQTDLPAEALACPNCGVDLTPLRRVEQLGHQCYNEALALCASGDTSGAITKLMAAGEMGAPAGNVHLLLGKLLWNSGRQEEARACWRQVPASAPEHAEAQQLLALPSEPAAGTAAAVAPPAPSWPYWAAGVLGILLMVLFAADVSYRSDHSSTNQQVEKLRRELDDALARAGPARPSSERLQKLAAALRAVPAVTLREEPGQLTVVFREGLFRGGSSRLVPDAAERLRAVAGVLVGCGECRFTVEGVTDSIPMPRGRGDNPALGFARARRAAVVLQKQAGPKEKWTVASTGSTTTFFPNDTPENRRRNRTVVVHISLQPQAGAK